METNFYRVEGQTDPTEITKRDGTKMNKCFVRLKELGSEYSDEFYAVVLGNGASVKYQKGELVAAQLRFSTHENNGAFYQDVVAQEIVRLK